MSLDTPAPDDPLARLASRKGALAAALLISLFTTSVLFFDVAFLGSTVQAWPWIQTANDSRRGVSGTDRLQDAWAGFLIEAPGIEITKKAFDAGRLPLWNPGEASGAPHLADGEHAVFSVLQYPLHRWGLGAWDAFALFRMGLACFLAMVLALAWGRTLATSWLVGAAFGFGPNFILHADLVHLNVTALLPLTFLAACALAHRRSLGRWLFASLVFGLALNGGNPQPVVAAAPAIALLALLDGPKGRTTTARAATLIALAGAGLFGALLTAASLLPMAELLQGRALTRAIFEYDAPARLSTLAAFISPCGGRMTLSTGILDAARGPAAWAMAPVQLLAALVATAAALLARRGRERALAWSVVIGVGVLVVPFLNAWLSDRAPVFRNVNWSKYVGGLQLAALLVASRLLDSARRGAFLAAAVAGLIVAIALHFGQSEPWEGRPALVLAATVVFLVCWLAPPVRFTWSLGVLVLGWMGGLLWLKPDFPRRPETPLPDVPPVMSRLKTLVAEAETKTGQPWRTTAMGVLNPPLLSSVTGWRDVRSVSPLPNRRYHALMAPWVNPGVWPPYLLLPASRQFLLSPIFDLLGVRYVLLHDAVLFTASPGRQPELRPATVAGEMLRAMVPGSLDMAGLLRVDMFAARCRFAPGGHFAMLIRPRASRLRPRFRLEGAPGARLHVRLGDTVQTVGPGEEAAFDVSPGKAPLPLRFDLESDGSGVIVFADWRVDRFLPKTAADFRFEPEWVDPEKGLLILENKTALAPIRILRKVRTQEDAALPAGFVAEGRGWDPREELLLHVSADDASSLLRIPDDAPPPSASEVVAVRRDRPEHLRIELDALAPGWLQIAEVQDGHWRALLDGQPARLFPADVAFQALPIPTAGRHVVELVYDPWPVRWGLRITFAALALWAGLFLLALVRRPSRPHSNAPRPS